MSADRLREALRTFMRGGLPEIDFLARYWATVVSQRDDGTIDVRPDDARIPEMPRVPVFAGLPGAQLKLHAGGRVLVGWDGGNRTKPYADSFDRATSSAETFIPADMVIVGRRDGAELAAKGQSLQDYLEQVLLPALAQHTHGTAGGGSTTASLTLSDQAPAPAGIKAPDLRASNVKVG